MSTALATQPLAADVEALLIGGDLSKLNADQRIVYYKAVCESVGLNPLTQPFEYLNLSGKLRLYARKDCTDQLRKIHSVSVESMTDTTVNDVYVVTCKVVDGTGRSDMAKGAVNIKGLTGENLANALMKTETKAKRRATLSICGLGMLDETEVEDTRNAAPAPPAPPAPAYTPPPKPEAKKVSVIVEDKPPAQPVPTVSRPQHREENFYTEGPAKPEAQPDLLTPRARVATTPLGIPVPEPLEMDDLLSRRTKPKATPKPEVPVGDPEQVKRAERVRQMIIGTGNDQLGWHPKHGKAWLKKYFGVDNPGQLSISQAADAELLLLARIAIDDPAYVRHLEMFAQEGRVLTAESDL